MVIHGRDLFGRSRPRGSFLALRKSPDRAELYERVRQRLLILREAAAADPEGGTR